MSGSCALCFGVGRGVFFHLASTSGTMHCVTKRHRIDPCSAFERKSGLMALALFQGPERDSQTLHEGVGRNKRGNEEQAERRRGGGEGRGVTRIPSREPRTCFQTPPEQFQAFCEGFVRTIAQLDVVGAADNTCSSDMCLFVGGAGDKDDGKPAGKERHRLTCFVCTISSLAGKSVTRARRRAMSHSAKVNRQLSLPLTHSEAAELSSEDRWEHLSDSNSLRRNLRRC